MVHPRNDSGSLFGHHLPFVVRNDDFKNAVFISLAIIVIVGTLSNALSLSVILFYRRLRLKPFNIILMFLNVIDLISCLNSAPALFALTLIYVRTNFVNYSFCQMSMLFHNVGKFGSLIIMSEIAVLRVINLSNKPSAKKLLSKNPMLIIITFSIIAIFGWAIWKTFIYNNICFAIKSSTTLSKIAPSAMWFSCLAIVVSCYTFIACYAKIRVGQLAVPRNEQGERYDIATIRTCVVIIAVFVLCHIPLLIYNLPLHEPITSIDIFQFTFYFQCQLFSQASNPLIVFCTCTEFRKHVLMFLRFLLRIWCDRNRVGVAVVDDPAMNTPENRQV